MPHPSSSTRSAPCPPCPLEDDDDNGDDDLSEPSSRRITQVLSLRHHPVPHHAHCHHQITLARQEGPLLLWLALPSPPKPIPLERPRRREQASKKSD